jgi:hypothetical protein
MNMTFTQVGQIILIYSQILVNRVFLIIETPSPIPFPFKASDNLFCLENIARETRDIMLILNMKYFLRTKIGLRYGSQ